jgi:hypothetical protein
MCIYRYLPHRPPSCASIVPLNMQNQNKL